ncbi:MAG TPA: fused MFS/spermidine synthase [Thermomicrobiales bacterium]|nr:fused MFS/spermidine synthase [Thermomicrobiales bacterium]
MSVIRYAKFAAFMGGVVGLGIELAAERLLAPAFGTTLDLWSLIIGLTFAALSLGYALGGRYIDRNPSPRFLGLCLFGAGVWSLGIAAFGRSIAFKIQEWTFDFGGVTLGIFLAVLALITVPPFLLGMVTPAAIRLTVPAVGTAGSSAGTIFGLSTIGSLIGNFVPVLLLIPLLGVQVTFILVGLVGILAAVPGLTGMAGGLEPADADGPAPAPARSSSTS